MALDKESLGSRSARAFSVLGIGRVIGLLIGIATIIIIARLLGPVGYGVFTLAFAFFSLIGATSNFGFGVYLTKFLSEYEEKKDRKRFGRALASGYLSVIIMGMLLTLLGIALSGTIASVLHDSGISSFTLMLASSVVFFFMLYGTSDFALIGMGRNTAAIMLENAENVVLIVASVALVLLGYGVDGAIAGLLISYIFASIIGVFFVFKYARDWMGKGIGWPSVKDVREAFLFSIPVAVNNFLSNAVVNFATLFLGFFVSAYEIGNYGIANRARNVLAVFYGTSAVALLPTLTIAASRDGKKKNAKGRFGMIYNKVLLYSMIATIPIVSYLGVFATPLIYLFISRNFGSAPMYLALIALGTILNLAGTYVTSLFVSKGKTRQLLTYSVFSTVAQLVALAVFVPMWGVFGAIIAIFFVGSIVNSYLFVWGAKKVLGLRTDSKKLLLTFASNIALAVLFAAGLFIGSFALELAWGAFVFLVAYPPLLIVFRVVSKEDLALLRKSFDRLPSLRMLTSPLLTYFKILMRYLQ